MNSVTTTANVTELTAVRLPRERPATSDGKFKEMLSGALKAKTKPATSSRSAKTDEPAATDTKPARNRSKSSKDLPSNDATQGAEAGINAAASNVTEPVQADESANSTEAQALSNVKPVQVSQPPSQPTETQQAESAQALQTAELDASGTAAQTAQTISDTQIQAAATEAQSAHAQTAQADRTDKADHAASKQTVTDEMAQDIVSVETVGQNEESQATHAYPNQRHAAPDSARQSRFDELLAKAAHVLGQSKAETAVTAQPEEPVTDTVYPAETVSKTVLPEGAKAFSTTEPEVEISVESTDTLPATETEAKQKPNTAAVKNDNTPDLEQKPSKELPKTDESVLGMFQPKPHEILAQDVTQPQTPVRPANVPEQAEQIRAQVIENLEKETMVFNMQLHPRELGRVDVRMVLESGRLSVEITAPNQKTAELLTRQSESLMASLKLGSLDVSSVNVVQANQTASGNMDGQYNLNNFRNQAGHGERSGYGGNNNGRGGNTETFESGQEEVSDTPQRLLNYSV